MNITLWVFQIVLALAFLGAGIVKISRPIEKLKTNMKWVEHVTPGTVRLVGVVELLGALGLILPAVTGILPWLTLAAAAGLALTMLTATFLHFRWHLPGTVAPIVLLLLALFVLIGRIVLAPPG